MKRGMLQLAAFGGLFALGRLCSRHRFRVFAYHGVSFDLMRELNFDGFFVAPAVFEAHLRTLKGHYHVMLLADVLRRIRDREPLPKNAAAITFDDGYANNYAEAAPLLARYELPATFFVTTGFLDGTHEPWWFALREEVFSVRCSVFSVPDGSERLLKTIQDRVAVVQAWEAHLKNLSVEARRNKLDDLIAEYRTLKTEHCGMMTWDHVRKLRAAGHDIGAHTVSHCSLGHEPPEVVEREVGESIARVRSEVGIVSPVFSCPYGEASHFTPELAHVLRQQGCLGGVTTIEGMNSPGADPYSLKRLNVTGNHDRNAFRALASGLMIRVRGM